MVIRCFLLLLVLGCLPFMSLRAGLGPTGGDLPGSSQGQCRVPGLALLSGVVLTGLTVVTLRR